jgi:hypothetical protein
MLAGFWIGQVQQPQPHNHVEVINLWPTQRYNHLTFHFSLLVVVVILLNHQLEFSEAVKINHTITKKVATIPIV